ncbi:hypothetical protein ACHAPE_007214 [Trichoderma viride]
MTNRIISWPYGLRPGVDLEPVARPLSNLFARIHDDRFSGGGPGNLFVASNPGIDHVFRGGTGQKAASASVSASALRPDREMSH